MNCTYIDHGFFQISEKDAIKLADGKLPDCGKERLCVAPKGFESTKGFVWLARTSVHCGVVWSIRDSRNWIQKDGRAVLTSE